MMKFTGFTLHSLCAFICLSCDAKPTTFHSTNTRLNSKATNPAEESDSQNGKNSSGSQTAKASKYNDTFIMPELVSHQEVIEVPLEPGKQQACEQSLGAPTCFTSVINGATNRTFSVTRATVAKTQISHSLTHIGKRVDVYAVLNDQFSLAGYQVSGQFPSRERMKQAISRLTSNLSETDWKLYVTGLLSGTGSVALPDAATISKSAAGSMDSKLDAVFQQPSMGDSRIFATLNAISDLKKDEDDNFSVHVYSVMTDSRNCRDNNQANSAVCGDPIPTTSKDYFRYIVDSHPHLVSDMKYMSLFGAWHRKTLVNDAACARSEQLESGTSAFQQLASIWNEQITGLAPSTWTGDMCGSNTELAWIDNLSASAKKLAAFRLRLPSVPGAFTNPRDAAYRLSVLQDGVAIPASKYSFVPGSTSILKFDESLSGSLDIVYHLPAPTSFDQTSFVNVFPDGEPESGSVSLSWNYGGSTGSINCHSGDTFPADPSVKCRQFGTSIYLRAADSIPLPTPQAGNQSIAVNYVLSATALSQIKVKASSNIIAPNLITFSGTTTDGDPVPQPSGIVTSTSDATLSFANTLPPGTYKTCVYEESKLGKSCALDSQASSTNPSVVCRNSSNVAFPCTLDSSKKSVSFSELLPIFLPTNKRSYTVNYNASLSPVASLLLKAPPFDSTMTIRLEDLSGNLVRELTKSDFVLAGANLKLNSAVQPGQRAKLSYIYSPTFSSSCFSITAKSPILASLDVKYGASGSEQSLASENFSLENATESEPAKICLGLSLLKPGHRLLISYLAE